MISVFHVSTDLKFPSAIERFEGRGFENSEIVFASKKLRYRQGHGPDPLVIPWSKEGMRRALEMARSHDLVVVHDLDRIKSALVNRLDPEVPVGWRFFGYELYRPHASMYLSDLTKKVSASRTSAIQRGLRQTARKTVDLWRWGSLPGVQFRTALSRVDFMFGQVPDEYDWLARRWGSLPTFIQFPFTTSVLRERPDVARKRDLVVIGNSRNMWNNHLDVIHTIRSTRAARSYQYVVPFSYGKENAYSGCVRERAREMEMQVLDTFMPRAEYQELLSRARAAVYNSYRQMALWNIAVCLTEGVQVFLQERNPTHQWLRRLGFVVSSVAELDQRLGTGRIGLTQEQATRNHELYRSMTDQYDANAFQAALRAAMGR